MMKQHKKHFQIVAAHATVGNRDTAIRYLQAMLRSSMSARATKEIETELAKYL